MLEGLEDVMKDVKRSTKVDASNAVEEYINKEDWRINANANTGYSHAGLVNNLAGKMVANFWLDRVYSKAEGDAHRNGDYHIHDLDQLAPYCFTKDTKIKTVEYGVISIADLLDKNVNEFTVYTTTLSENDELKMELEEDYNVRRNGVKFESEYFVTRKAKNLRKTRENAELVEVEFGGSHSHKVRCTPDHKFLVTYVVVGKLNHEPYRHFRWVEAKDLMPVMLLNNTGADGKPHSNLTDVVCADGTAAWVKSVTLIDKAEDVYCMEVEGTHCFALENGAIAHNCCGHDLARLLDEGFNGVISRVGSKAPKHVREALYQMANFIGILQAEWAGAQAFSSFDTYLAPLTFFDIYYGGLNYDDIKKAVRNFVYNLNVPSRWGQSPFSNLTIDIQCPRDLQDRNPQRNGKPFFVDVYEEYEKAGNIDGNKAWDNLTKALMQRISEVDKDAYEGLKDLTGPELYMTLGFTSTYKYFEPEMALIVKAYYEVLNEGDAYGLPFTFPIPTVNITEEFNWDSEISDLIFENAAKYGSSYFQNFIGSQYKRNPNTGKLERDPNAYKPSDVRSMCPLTFDTQVVTKTKWETTLRKIGEMYHTQNDKGANYKVFNNGKWYDCDVICVGKQNTYTVSTSNNMSIELGEHHLQPILRDNKEITIEAKDIKIGDMIPWNIHPIDGILNSGYDIGYVVGAYLGDGSADDCGGINYSLSADDKDIETTNIIRNFFEALGFRVKEKINGNLRTVRVGAGSYDIIKKYFIGDNALTKTIASNIITYSIDTRQGILDGLIATDGLRKSSRISTSSKGLVDSINTLAMSVGLKSYCSFEDTRDNRLSSNPNYLVSLIFEKLNYKDKFKTVNGKAYYYVTDIKNNNIEKTLYCVEIEDDNSDRLFVLGNGMITHNCRLQLDKTQIRKKLEKRGGGLFGSDAQTGCYDEETEVLTANGWKHFRDVTFNDEFYTITPERKIELHKPINLFKYDFDGDMCRFKSDSLDLLVTPNHRMLLTHNSGDQFRFKEAKDCNHAFVAPLTGNWQGKHEDYYIVKAAKRSGCNGKVHSDVKIDMNTWLKFLGLFISEGSVRGSKNGRSNDRYDYEIIITQRKIENISLIDEVMSKMPYDVKKYIQNDTCRWSIRDKSLWEELRPLGCSYQKYIPEYVFKLPSDQLKHLFTYLILGDGHIRKDNGHTEYYTSSVRLKNDVEHLAMLIGYGTNTRENKVKHCVLRGREVAAKHTNYTISFNIAKNRGVRGYTNEYYKGSVYCVEVPNNTLYVRRNGKTVWCGNSVGVVTINMARLGYNFKGNIKGLYKQLFKLMDMAKNTLEKKRKFVTSMNERGLYPYTHRYVRTLDTFFSTIGVNGMNEMIRNFTDDEYDIVDPRGQQMATEVLDAIRNRLIKYQEETGNMYNLEGTPAERNHVQTGKRRCKAIYRA